MTTIVLKSALRTTSLIALLTASGSLAAQDAPAVGPKNFNEASSAFISEAKPILNARLRYSFADFDNLALDANGLTYRFRAGAESGAVFGTKFLVEMEHTDALIGDFNSTTNGLTTRPVVADPDSTELNRIQLVNTSIPNTKITLGRQRIIQDDARFIGNVGWRQNEQTYDALRIENTSIPNLKLDLTYVDRVNRIFGSDSPQGFFESDSFLLHGTYTVPTEEVKATVKAFAYLLDLENENTPGPAARLSTETYGATVTLGVGPVNLLGTYATQSPYGDSTLDYSADYYTLSGNVKLQDFKLIAGYEVLGSDNGLGFVTPLATAHKFNGFADLFLATPANGLQDIYAGVDYTKKGFGPFGLFKLVGTYHDFSADVGGQSYGEEFNLLFVSTFKALKDIRFLLKFADFRASAGFAQDRTRLTIQAEYKF